MDFTAQEFFKMIAPIYRLVFTFFVLFCAQFAAQSLP